MGDEFNQSTAPEGGSVETQGPQEPAAPEQPYSWNQDHANFYATHFEQRLKDANDPQIKAFVADIAKTHGLTRAEAKHVAQQAQQQQQAQGGGSNAELKASMDKIAALEKRFADMDATALRDRNQSILQQHMDAALAATQYGKHKNPLVAHAMRELLENGLTKGAVTDFSAAGMAKFLDGKMAELAKALTEDVRDRERDQRRFTALSGGASTAALGKEKKTLSKDEAAQAISEAYAAMNEASGGK